MLKAVLLALSFVLLPCVALADPDVDDKSGPSQGGATNQQIDTILNSGLVSEFAPPHPLAFGPGELKEMGSSARDTYPQLRTELGDPSKDYDLVLQPGHYGRTSGATGGEGKYVTEQQIAAKIVDILASNLRKRGVTLAIIPADGFKAPLKSKVFLSLHTDASNYPCSVGPSIGYSADGDALGMHGIAAALAITLSIDPQKFMRDNYTANLRGYYAFRSITTRQFKGLLEMSELTCPAQEENLLSRADLLANNLAIAVAFALRPAQR
jgi:hypothetical protein